MDSISQYMYLVQRRPDLFVQSPHIPLCLDEGTLRAFSAASGKPVGVVYDNSPYYLVLADLCVGAGGRLYTYARVVYSNSNSNGVVVIPQMGSRFGLLSIYRHPPRVESFEFPRGFAEDMTPAQNAARELWEETGARVHQDSLIYLGDVRADTGLSAGRVQIFLAQIAAAASPPEGSVGINGLSWMAEGDLREKIAAGIITDGFTLAAFAQYLCAKEALCKGGSYNGKNRPPAEQAFGI